MKKYSNIILKLICSSILITSCNKTKTTTCDSCDQVKNTVFFALDWKGVMSYESDLNKWSVNVHIPNTIDGLRVCVLCSEIPDSLKVIGKQAVFSGAIKETCAKTKIQIGGQETYSVSPSKIE
jgi:hypothetical protein